MVNVFSHKIRSVSAVKAQTCDGNSLLHRILSCKANYQCDVQLLEGLRLTSALVYKREGYRGRRNGTRSWSPCSSLFKRNLIEVLANLSKGVNFSSPLKENNNH